MPNQPYHLLLATLLFAQAAACQAARQPLTPDQLGSRFVGAINSSDTSVQEAVAKEVYTAATQGSLGLQRLTAHFQELHRRYAPLDYHHSERLEFKKPAGTAYVLHIYARKKGEVTFPRFLQLLWPVVLLELGSDAGY